MAGKRYVVVDETIRQVISEELTEKQAKDFVGVVGPASHSVTVEPVADDDEAPAPGKPPKPDKP